MTGYIPVEIPTKRYIKAYVMHMLGEKPYMNNRHHIGNKLYDVLNHQTNERKNEFSNKRYNERLKVYVSYHTWRQRGAYLNETNIKNFNLYIEKELKDKFYLYMDFYISILPNFTANLPEVRRRLGIDIFHWEEDSMRKDYYRYRKEAGLPPLYSKNSTRTVPSVNFTHFSF